MFISDVFIYVSCVKKDCRHLTSQLCKNAACFSWLNFEDAEADEMSLLTNLGFSNNISKFRF